MVRLAILPDGLGGNGSTSCATLALGAATIRQDRLIANSRAFIAQNIAAHSIVVFVLAVMCVLPASVSPSCARPKDSTPTGVANSLLHCGIWAASCCAQTASGHAAAAAPSPAMNSRRRRQML